VKITIHGPLSGRDWNGQMVGWAPDTLIEVDDRDEKAVAWAKGWAATPHATLVEDVKAKAEKEPAKEPAKAEPKAAAKEPAKEPAKQTHPAGKSSK
jgi:hypothetical protein